MSFLSCSTVTKLYITLEMLLSTVGVHMFLQVSSLAI